MKKYFLFLIAPLLLWSCGIWNLSMLDVLLPKEIPPQQYETPNGKEYLLYQSGASYFFKKSDGSNSELFSGSGSLKSLLDSKNPLVVDQHSVPNGKHYQVTQYKAAFGYIKSDGIKGEKTFATKEEILKFLDEANPVCHVSFETYVDPDMVPDDHEKLSGKIRIVSFDFPSACTYENGSSEPVLIGESGAKYSYFDSIVMQMDGGGGFEEDDTYVAPKQIYLNSSKLPDGTSSNANIALSRDDSAYVYFGVDSVSVSAEVQKWSSNPKRLELVTRELDFIRSSMKMTTRTPSINWSKVTASFWENHEEVVKFTDNVGIKRIVRPTTPIGLSLCNPSDFATSTGLFCSFIKYDKKTNSVIIQLDVERNFGLWSEQATYRINVSNGKVTELE